MNQAGNFILPAHINMQGIPPIPLYISLLSVLICTILTSVIIYSLFILNKNLT